MSFLCHTFCSALNIFYYFQKKAALKAAGQDLADSANLLDEGDEDLLF